MLRLAVIAVLTSAVFAANGIDVDLLNEIFGVLPDNLKEENENNTFSQCNDIQGTQGASGCYECYPCDHERINKHTKSGHTINNFQLSDNNCKTVRVCCVSQGDLGQRSGNDCGTINPEGIPRQRRPSARAVLPGEYPWRAWVVKKNNPGQILCAATLITRDPHRALITPASCIVGNRPEDLMVTFSKHSSTSASAVGSVFSHTKYDSTNHNNDIAILTLRSGEHIPPWAYPACLPLAPPPHATPCTAISANEIFINNGIPVRSKCSNNGTAMDISQLCTVAPRGDYSPEKGAGLFCVEQHLRFISYTVFGMAIDKLDSPITTYTNVFQFIPWIEKTLNIN